ncbi:MAG: hypothetical protein ACFFAH_11225 [Promethearchaeota archaeon]
MTKSYLTNEIHQNKISELWEQNIIARRFTIRTISKQVIYNLNVYFREKESLMLIIVFSFLGFIQLLFYTLGAFLVKLKYRDMPSLRN